MKILSFFERSSRNFRHSSPYSKFLVLLAVSTGGGIGLVAYSDAKSDHPSSDTKKKKVVVLGTGWAGTSFLKDVDCTKYDVQVVSPRNYFMFTPLLPSVTCGSVEARSIVEPVRRIINKKNGDIKFWEAECLKIDPKNKKVHCRSNHSVHVDGKKEFSVEYDYLIVAIGARANTFNTPGVTEHCHFLKEVDDAQRIRRSVMDCFERANLPDLSYEERKNKLNFVIVGGGPTGVEFAAELHDLINEDLVRLYPALHDLVKISVIEAGDHILSMFDKRISSFAEEKFHRDGIDLKTGYMVVNVSDKEITMKEMQNGKVHSLPYGMIVWSTGIATRPIILDLMKEIGQANRRVLATDEWLRVEGCENVFALGDCATIQQRKVMEDITAIFNIADKDNSGTLTADKVKKFLEGICERYPQMEIYMKHKQVSDLVDLLYGPNGKSGTKELSIEDFKAALTEVDSKTKFLPATAQVAAQQGTYLAKCFNKMEEREHDPEGPPRIRATGRHRFHPFRYRHLGQFAPLGGEQAAAELPGDWISIGQSTQWLWYSVYASKQVSWRNRMLVISDWMRRFIFGRDSSRI
ncbi:hypothetical protein H6P81_020838 [Aristolochia fimbriata]|uniref:NADH:ubiquinone reductase (non-electrogenic) n=1 Tax=Aristolochia fimbriata TaxID=158543 RepID=A0AAV7DZT9_ARIFI|nr:hypothetical protein H6P81_020838 [Aristolochia fimbriata]